MAGHPWRDRRILSFAREAGAGDALGPVLLQLRDSGAHSLVFAADAAVVSFRRQGVACQELRHFTDDGLDASCRASWRTLPDVVFTSATSLPSLDMTERYLWRWAAARGVPSAAVIDQWQNYALRFSGNSSHERLAYLPDAIFLMDEVAFEEAVADGVPANRLRITGQPALDALVADGRPLARVKALRSGLAIDPAALVVVFVAESLARDFGASLGYDEYSVLRFVIDLLIESVSAASRPIHLIVKLHPQNRRDAFDHLLHEMPFPTSIVGAEMDTLTVVGGADLVVGMSSIVLVHALLLRRPTVSLELNASGGSTFIGVRVGALPFLRNRAEAREIVTVLLRDADARARWVERQNRWSIRRGDAVARVLHHLESIIRERAHV
jgi:hypothetical protein